MSLKVKFHGAAETAAKLANLPGNLQRKVMREAMRKSARPIVVEMRRAAKRISTQSKRGQGTGATSRAIDSKVGQAKGNKDVSYALVGGRKGYSETLHFGRNRRLLHIRKNQTIGSRRNRRVRQRDLINMGPAARKARLRGRRSSTQLRRPSRYLHLLEKGTSRGARAFRLMQDSAERKRSEVVSIFSSTLDAAIVREMNASNVNMTRTQSGLIRFK